MTKDNVTAEDLVRALKQANITELAKKLEWGNDPSFDFSQYTADGVYLNAILWIIEYITLPEDKPDNRVIWRDGTPPPPALKLDELPFSEPINGVEQ